MRNQGSRSRWVLGLVFAIICWGPARAWAQEGAAETGIDGVIDAVLSPVADLAEKIIFVEIPLGEQAIPVVLVLLGGTAVFLTLYFRFVNLWAFGIALRTVRGKYTDPRAPGQISHFQALSTALSATVGLGNIAGVAVAIGLGGPGATFWMILMGICGMTTKFCECTLGVRYRRFDDHGRVHGGGMYYLSRGLKERGAGTLGAILAAVFAVMCVGGAFGAGNMFQVNQAHDQFFRTFGLFEGGWAFGAVLAILAGLVIIGGIVSIARVTSFLVPIMCITYVITALIIILGNLAALPEAVGVILRGAFSPEAVGGGFVGVLIQGIKRAAFSNEAGLGSAPIAHSAVITDRPASEGVVALLEPFVDTVVVCTMTALVIVTTGVWKVNADVRVDELTLRAAPEESAAATGTLPAGTMLDIVDRKTEGEGDDAKVTWMQVKVYDSETGGWVRPDSLTLREGWSGGVYLTSQAFTSKIAWFDVILAIAVLLFAFSTMISWSYYGEQAVVYLFGPKDSVILTYKVIFCLFAIIGGGASLSSVLRLSDAMVFGMVFPNLIGIYVLLPVVRREFNDYLAHIKGK